MMLPVFINNAGLQRDNRQYTNDRFREAESCTKVQNGGYKMKVLTSISKFVSKYMALIAIAVTVFAFLVDGSFTSWVANANVLGGFITVNHLLMVVMFGMGLTLKLSDFATVFKRPKDVLIGCVAQFTVMPFLAFVLCKVFQLPTELAVGVMLVGTCPGGTSSNVMTYMAKGDVALSVGMTAVSTILAPFLTPALTWFYLRTSVDVNMYSMFISIIQVVIVPIALGFIINKFFEKVTQALVEVLPLVSVTAICVIIGFVMDANNEKLMTCGFLIIVVVMLHNMCGYGLGFLIAKLFKLETPKRNAIAIEVGMQNSGLATSLAGSAFSNLALATVPGAVFSAWHNISGAIVANIMAAQAEKQKAGK